MNKDGNGNIQNKQDRNKQGDELHKIEGQYHLNIKKVIEISLTHIKNKPYKEKPFQKAQMVPQRINN